MMKKIDCFIPTRLSSTRLPNKPLVKIDGIPLIERAFSLASESSLFADVTVLVDRADSDLISFLGSKQIPFIETESDCVSGTDRIGSIIDNVSGDIFCNFQGDIALLEKDDLETFINLSLSRISKSTLPIVSMPATKFVGETNVITNKNNRILYGSRKLTSFGSQSDHRGPWGLYGVYLYNRDAINEYRSVLSSPLENLENLEFMRFVELDIPVFVELLDDFFCMEVNEDWDVLQIERVIKGVDHDFSENCKG